VLITTVLLANGRLFGPPADALLDPVPQSDLHRAMVDCIPDLLNDLDSDTCNGVLTLARIWTTLETGAIEPKDAAAGWVLERLPHEHRAPLAYARAVYLGADPPADTRAGDVHAHAAYVIGEITRLAR
jgi:streptomycin 3"-adenylyltransferase